MKLFKLNNIFLLAACITLGTSLSSCEEELDPESIFANTPEELDPNSSSYRLDKYLQDNFRKEYNLQFRYKLQDVGADMNFNLVPTSYEKAVDMALLNKYLWFDVYKKVVSEDFLKIYGPRIIHLIGSPAYNPANHTMILGLAEGGLKVSLFRCNSIDANDVDMLNEYYFKTMHHEFSHILHQTKTYPNEFNLLSTQFYEPTNWQDRNDGVVNSLGFVTPYGSSQPREDFAETIANYIVKTDKQWNEILTKASKGWKEIVDDNTGRSSFIESEDLDGVDGKAVILQKVSIARNWFKDAWGMDLDALRAEVQLRQSTLDMNKLREEEGFGDFNK